jgi:hypothetical protein
LRTGATTPTSCATACGHIGLRAVRKAKLKIGAIRGNLGIVSQELRSGQVELRLDGTTTIAGYDSIVLRAAVCNCSGGNIRRYPSASVNAGDRIRGEPTISFAQDQVRAVGLQTPPLSCVLARNSEPFRAFLGAILSVVKDFSVESTPYSSDMQLDLVASGNRGRLINLQQMFR